MKINLKLYSAIWSSKFFIFKTWNKKSLFKVVSVELLINNLKQLIRNVQFLEKNKGKVFLSASTYERNLLFSYFKVKKSSVFNFHNNHNSLNSLNENCMCLFFHSFGHSNNLFKILNSRQIFLLTEVSNFFFKNKFNIYKINTDIRDYEKLFFIIAIINKLYKNEI